ncbi:MAG: hypothetical protein ABFS03_02805 [Chloroflexota bacterium]
MTDDKPPLIDRIWKWIGWISLVSFVGFFLLSIWIETLIPLIDAGDTRAVVRNILGTLLILIGMIGILYGGFYLFRNTLRINSLEAYHQNIEIINAYPSPEEAQLARRKNIRLLLLAWKPGTRWMLVGILLILLGSYLINN